MDVQTLTQRIEQLELAAKMPCPGCAVLQQRIEHLEASLAPRLDAVPETEITNQKVETGELDDIGVLLQEAQQVQDGALDEAFAQLLSPGWTPGGMEGEAHASTPVVFSSPSDLGLQSIPAEIEESPPNKEALETEDGPSRVVQGTGSEQQGRPAEQPARQVCHLILGDSIAKALNLPHKEGEVAINLSESGNTWRREATIICDHMGEWVTYASRIGASLGDVFVWMGGNETYGRPGLPPVGLSERAVTEVLQKLVPIAKVTLAGPTIRLFRDKDKNYEETAAFLADRKLAEMGKQAGAHFIPYIGRALTINRREGRTRRHVVTTESSQYFRDRLGVHLNEAGYERVRPKLTGVFNF